MGRALRLPWKIDAGRSVRAWRDAAGAGRFACERASFVREVSKPSRFILGPRGCPVRRTSLARRNLAHQPARTCVSLLGIGFAILLMYMQLGFLGSVGDTATNVYRRIDGDVVVRSPEYLHVYDPRSIDESVLGHLASIAEVTSAEPIDLGLTKWQSPTSGQFRGVAVMGVDVDRSPLRVPGLAAMLGVLRRPDHVLVDGSTRADFGPADGVRFGAADIGRTTDVMGRRVRIAGTFEMGTGLAANGAILVSREGFRRITPRGGGEVSLAVVRLASGVDAAEGARVVGRQLRRIGGPLAHAEVLSMDQAIAAEKRRWYRETPIGMIFAMGVALAVVVGGVICYMVLAADVLAHLPEYATLKAIGYGDRYLARTLLTQAGYMAGLALPPATLAAFGLYAATSWLAGVTIRMTWEWLVLVSVLAFVMCGLAGCVAVRKLSKAEPASLF